MGRGPIFWDSGPYSKFGFTQLVIKRAHGTLNWLL